MTRFLLLPGLYDSGPAHWQSRWEASDPACVRVRQADWATPRRDDWVATLEAAVAAEAEPPVLVGHSTSCLLVAFWSAASVRPVRGALLVAPSDSEAPSYPAGPTGWAPVPLARLRFPSILVASSDDQYVSLPRARQFAAAWGSRLVEVGARGHINGESGLGDWPEGRALADALARGEA